MKDLYYRLIAKVMTCGKSFRREERGAVDIVAIVVMIGIAVALAVMFRTQIQGLLTQLFNSITSNATTAVS